MTKTIEVVRKIFPEANRITDKELREKVLKTWLEGWKLSHFDQIEKIPFIRGMLKKISLVDHTRMVTRMCIQFAKMMQEAMTMQINLDYLIAGAILHDLGKMFEYCEVSSDLGRLFSHPISAVYIASKEDLPLEIIHLIGMHTLEGNLFKRTVEATILHSIDSAYSETVFISKAGTTVAGWRKANELRDIVGDKRSNRIR